MYTPQHIGVLVAMAVIVMPCVGSAKVAGQCGNCHTMHNSQNNSEVVQNMVNGVFVESSAPNEALLNTNCIGCHQGDNSSGGFVTPYVLQTTAPTYNATGTEGDTTTLAGGNFYWVSNTDEAMGHNVEGIAPVDSRLGNIPPGSPGDTPLDSQLTCAGTTGCHGDRSVSGEINAMLTAHHGNDTTVWKTGDTLAQSYRFLLGVQGLEDLSYEYRPNSGQHNKYYGKDRTSSDDEDQGTISSLCAQCHSNFHNGASQISSGGFGTSSSVWLRHPTDFDMGRAQSSTEYDGYNGGTGTNNTYSVISPVATANTSATVNSTVFTIADDAIVMCLSCHRAHGTPYKSILRWDYKAWPGGGYNGCAVCHTTKD